ncbi:hypothetical protein CW751_11790 [Brumimicrobium salinarum]|uniref:Secretion system C-terminal sorting domain-containing protein n=1 Tax=Brumimicrobium salinarum TaxID=2058658 RepID=A0A2I0R0E0_9FLAO|nr:T9SS type A sorting domain-containing protein [Brumimicrobium salinarum]PKR80043.1 hypothetical protein CW751_11790 [Brumimicrobium salinarum]
MKHKILLFLVLFFVATSSQAQKIIRSSINSLGSVTAQNGIKLSQTVGQGSQHATVNSDDATIILHQGFQQPNSSVKRKSNSKLYFNIYPNPNKGSFTVDFETRKESVYNYSIIDSQGRLYTKAQTTINGSKKFNLNLPSGSYMLKINNPEGESGISKIIILP